MKIAALTIYSLNYMPRALVLCASYRRHHPDHQVYVLIVDRKSTSLFPEAPGITFIWVEDLGVDDFLKHALAFDIIELNTNVKPAALKYLLARFDKVLYLDPDIQVLSPLNTVFDALDGSAVVVTPHANMPLLDGKKPDDLEFLRFGAFNLGFIGVSSSQEANDFLDWWSERCLKFGFYEPQLGLAVDQKWVNLAPAYFPGLKVLRDPGLNIAFWNLHERRLSLVEGRPLVNDAIPIKFIHFSSFDPSAPEKIANKQSRFPAGSRPDFEMFARDYAKELLSQDFERYSGQRYGFDYFEDGTYVTPALRRFYAALRWGKFSGDSNPFAASGPIWEFARKHGLIPKRQKEARREIFRDIGSYRTQIRVILAMLRIVLFALGPNRYFALMKYLAHISSLRNQTDMFSDAREDN